jgi:hypothetical protein
MQVGEIHSSSYRTKFREGRLPDLADVPADQDAEYRPLTEQEISVQVAENICSLAFGQDNAVKRHARPRTSQIEHCQPRPGDMQRKPNNARRRSGQLIERAGKPTAVPRLQHGCSVWQAWSGAGGHDPIVADTPDSWHAGQSATSLPAHPSHVKPCWDAVVSWLASSPDPGANGSISPADIETLADRPDARPPRPAHVVASVVRSPD